MPHLVMPSTLHVWPGNAPAWLIAGGLIGLIVGRLMRGGFGIFIDIVVGLIGAYVAGILFDSYVTSAATLVQSMGVAAIGAVILTAVLRIFRHGSAARQATAAPLSTASPAPQPATAKRPVSLGHWFLHIRKTFRLLGTLLRDPRVSFIRKALFLLAILIFGVVLIIPDSIIIAALAVILPLASPFFGIPAGVIDIAALSVVMYGMLMFFPRDIVAQHAAQLYGPHPDISPHTLTKENQIQ